jgi:hypothetical protein
MHERIKCQAARSGSPGGWFLGGSQIHERAQLQGAFNAFDGHIQVLGKELEATLAPQILASFPDFKTVGFGAKGQVELHITEELSLFAATQVGLQTSSDHPPDFNSKLIGRVNLGGRPYDALWSPIGIGVIIHIGAGGEKKQR